MSAAAPATTPSPAADWTTADEGDDAVTTPRKGRGRGASTIGAAKTKTAPGKEPKAPLKRPAVPKRSQKGKQPDAAANIGGVTKRPRKVKLQDPETEGEEEMDSSPTTPKSKLVEMGDDEGDDANDVVEDDGDEGGIPPKLAKTSTKRKHDDVDDEDTWSFSGFSLFILSSIRRFFDSVHNLVEDDVPKYEDKYADWLTVINQIKSENQEWTFHVKGYFHSRFL